MAVNGSTKRYTFAGYYWIGRSESFQGQRQLKGTRQRVHFRASQVSRTILGQFKQTIHDISVASCYLKIIVPLHELCLHSDHY